MKQFLRENESISNGMLHMSESYVVAPKVAKESAEVKQILSESTKRMVLKPRIDAIHVGRTRNDNIYPADKLRGDLSMKPHPTGVYSFLYPYPKPMLKNHDPESEPTGRIMNAQFVRNANGSESVIIIPHITDQETIEKILDGRYLTVSIGATTDSATCNICGKDIINEGWCEHERGVVYDGVRCGWIVGNLWFNECSWVTIPADPEARIIDVGEPQTMETYMEMDNQVYDLSGDHGGAAVKESVASMLGLVASVEKSEGGLGTVSDTTKTLSVEEFAALEEKANKLETLETQIAEKDQTIAEKDALVAEKESALAEKDTQIAEKDSALQEKDTTIATLTSEKESLETKITTLEAEKQALVDQNTELSAKSHKDLVEKVVDLKIALGKPGVENREEAIAALSTRTAESLSDTFEDLMVEVREGKKSYVPAKVTNPAGGAIPGENNSTIEGLENESTEELDDATIIAKLLSGAYKKNIKGGK